MTSMIRIAQQILSRYSIFGVLSPTIGTLNHTRNYRFDKAIKSWRKTKGSDWLDLCVREHFYLGGYWDYAREVYQRSVDRQSNAYPNRYLIEYCTNIGHMGLIDMYIKADKFGLRPDIKPLLAYGKKHHLISYWEEYIDSVPFEPYMHESTDAITVIMDKSGKLEVPEDYTRWTIFADIQRRWESEGRKPLIKLRTEDLEYGWNMMPSMDWFVGLHVRQGSSRTARNADPKTYYKAIKTITDSGGWVVNMGDGAPIHMEHVLNINSKDDRMNTFLFGACKFFVGTQSGPAQPSSTFGIPVLGTNWMYASVRFYKDDVSIFKILVNPDGKFVNFGDAFSSPFGKTEDPKYLKHFGYRFLNNTADEINDAVLEMLGKVERTTEDDELYTKFKALYEGGKRHLNSKVGTRFLRKWRCLL